MPLRSLQEIIIAYAQHLYEEGRFRALDSSIEYPFPPIAVTRDGSLVAGFRRIEAIMLRATDGLQE